MSKLFIFPALLLLLMAVSCNPAGNGNPAVSYSPATDSLLRDTARMTFLGDSIRHQLLTTHSDSLAIDGLSRLTEFYFNRQAQTLADNALALSQQPGNESSQPAAWCARGIAAHRSQQYDTAFYFLRKAIELAGKYGDAYSGLRAAVWTGDCLRMTYRIREAQHLLDSCADAAGSEMAVLQAQALSLAGDVYRFENKDSIAFRRYDRAIELAMSAGDSARVAFALAGKAQLIRKSGESEKIFNALHRGLAAAKSVSDLTRAAFILSTLGDEYRFRGKNAEALACYNEAVEYARRQNEKRRLGILFNVITQAYWSQGDYEKALQINQQAMTALSQVNDPASMAFTLSNRGEVYRLQKKLDSALIYYRRSQEISASLDDQQRMGYNYAAIADIFSELKNYDSALVNANRAYTIGKESGDLNISSDALRIKAMTEARLGLFAEAKQSGEQALTEARGANNSSTMSASYEVLHTAYRELGMMKESLEAFEKFFALNDSVKGSEQIRKLAGVEYQAKEASLKADQAKREAKIEAEKKIQEHLIGQQRTVILAGIAGGFLLLVLLGVAYKAYRSKKRANILIAQQKSIVEEQHREITDSINYAQRIQQAILPSEEELNRHFTSLFVLFRPRNIVSGDFYWFGESNENKVIALADCTGHGVPGGFMSMLGFEILQDMILREEIKSTSDALVHLDEKLTSTLNKNSRSYRDGMDMAICAFRQGTNIIQYSGANRPLIHISSGGRLTHYKPDKHPIGGGIDDTEKIFTHTEIEVNPGDMIYLFSDGYPDQFGGEKGKKFKIRQFEEVLLSVYSLPLPEQKQMLLRSFEEWRGNLEQVDDICVIGLRI